MSLNVTPITKSQDPSETMKKPEPELTDSKSGAAPKKQGGSVKTKLTVSKKSSLFDLVLEGIQHINDRKGASLAAIKKYVNSNIENSTEAQLKSTNTKTLKLVKKATEDGVLLEKKKLRYALSEKTKKDLNTEKKKKVKAEKKKQKKAEEGEKSGKTSKEKEPKTKAKKTSEKKKPEKEVKAKKKNDKKADEPKKVPLIKGKKARKSLSKVTEMNRKQKLTVVVLPKKQSAPKSKTKLQS